MEFWRTKKFKHLQSEWNQKLKESGFEDIETESKGQKVLKQRATNSYRQKSQIERDSKLEYYLLVENAVNSSDFFEQFDFFHQVDQFVMVQHLEGATIQEIIEGLNAKGISRDRKTIRFIIRRWQAKWKIREWKPNQMNLKGTSPATRSWPISAPHCRKSSKT